MAQLYNILTVCLCIFTDNFFFSATEFLSVCFHIELEYLPLEVNRGFNFLFCVYCINFNTPEKTPL